MSSDPKSILNQMIQEQRQAALLTHQNFSVPPPQPGMLGAKPTRATGSRVQFGRLGCFPSLVGKSLSGQPQLVVDFVRTLTSSSNSAQTFYSQMGGPSPNPHVRDASKTLSLTSNVAAGIPGPPPIT